MKNIQFKSKESNELWCENEDNEYLCLTTQGTILHWKKDYGQNWYYEDVSNNWITIFV